MGATGAILFAAGTGVSAVGQYSAGKYQSSVYGANQQIANLQAEDALARGRADERRLRQDVKRVIGAQRAAFAASGVEIDEGSALDVQLDTATLGELDALTIRNNAAREAWGYRVQAYNYGAQAKLARQQGTIGAASTLLTGGAQAYWLSKK